MILIKNLKSRKGLCCVLFFGLSVSQGMAQMFSKNRITMNDSTYQATQAKQWSVGVQVGVTQLPGVDVSYKFAPKWQARVGFGWMRFDPSYEQMLTTQDFQTSVKAPKSVLINASVRMSQLSATIEFLPLLSGNLRLITGFAWFPKKEISATASLKNASLGVIESLTPEEIGKVTVNLGYKNPVAPYFGVGFGRLIPRYRWNISGELGGSFLGNYKVNSIEVQEGIILKEAEQNAPVLEKNLNANSKYKWYPNLNIRLGVRLF